MEDALGRAKRYLGVRFSAVVQAGLGEEGGDVDAVGRVVERILVYLWEERIRPSPSVAWRKRMRDEGRCVVCGKPAWQANSSHCQDHREKRRKRSQ